MTYTAGPLPFGSVRLTEHGAITFLFGKRNKDPIVVRGARNTCIKADHRWGSAREVCPSIAVWGGSRKTSATSGKGRLPKPRYA